MKILFNRIKTIAKNSEQIFQPTSIMSIALTINNHTYKSVANRSIIHVLNEKGVEDAVRLRTNVQKVTDWFGITEHESVIRDLFGSLEHADNFVSWQRDILKLASFVKDKNKFKEAFKLTSQDVKGQQQQDATLFTVHLFDTEITKTCFTRNNKLSANIFKQRPESQGSDTAATYSLVDHFYTLPYLSPIAFILESCGVNNNTDTQYIAQTLANKLGQCKNSDELYQWIADLSIQVTDKDEFKKLLQIDVHQRRDSSTATISLSGIPIAKIAFAGNLTLNDRLFVDTGNLNRASLKSYTLSEKAVVYLSIMRGVTQQWGEMVATGQLHQPMEIANQKQVTEQIAKDIDRSYQRLPLATPPVSSDENAPPQDKCLTQEEYKKKLMSILGTGSPTSSLNELKKTYTESQQSIQKKYEVLPSDENKGFLLLAVYQRADNAILAPTDIVSMNIAMADPASVGKVEVDEVIYKQVTHDKATNTSTLRAKVHTKFYDGKDQPPVCSYVSEGKYTIAFPDPTQITTEEFGMTSFVLHNTKGEITPVYQCQKNETSSANDDFDLAESYGSPYVIPLSQIQMWLS